MVQSQYATIAQLQTLAITQAAATRFGTPAMEAALQASSSICDSYLGAQFTLPLRTNPVGWTMDLVLATCAIAAYLLYNQFGFSPNAPGDELIKRRVDAAYKWLEQIRDEEIFPLFIDASGEATPAEEAGVYVVSDAPVGFTDRGLSSSVETTSPWWPC